MMDMEDNLLARSINDLTLFVKSIVFSYRLKNDLRSSFFRSNDLNRTFDNAMRAVSASRTGLSCIQQT